MIQSIRTYALRHHRPEALAAILAACPEGVEHSHADAELRPFVPLTEHDVLLEIDGPSTRILVSSNMDDSSLWERTIKFGAQHTIVLPDGLQWLYARLHDEPDPDKQDQFASGWLNRYHPSDPPADPLEAAVEPEPATEHDEPPLPEGFVMMAYHRPGDEGVAYSIVTADGKEHRLGNEEVEYTQLTMLVKQLNAPAVAEADTLDQVIASQGWNDASVVNVLMSYIERQGSPQAFAGYLWSVVHSENSDD